MSSGGLAKSDDRLVLTARNSKESVLSICLDDDDDASPILTYQFTLCELFTPLRTGLVSPFNGISTIVGYSIPKSSL